MIRFVSMILAITLVFSNMPISVVTFANTTEPAQSLQDVEGQASVQMTVEINHDYGEVRLNGNPYKDGETFEVTAGESIDIDVTPDDGYKIQSISIGGENQEITDESKFTKTVQNIKTNTTIEVAFIEKEVPRQEFDVTVDTNENNGEVIINGTKLTDGGTVSVLAGQPVEVSITAKDGYDIQSVTIGDENQTITDKKRFSKRIEKITEDTTITVIFAVTTHTISFTVNGEGTVKDGDIDIISDGGQVRQVQQGADFSFLIVPATGYHLAGVRIDGAEINLEKDENLKKQADNSYQYTFQNVTKDCSVEVFFAINEYSVRAEPTENGTAHLDKGIVRHGGTAILTMTPDADYRVASVTINETQYTDISDDPNFIEDEEGNVIFNITNITSDTVVKVKFQKMDSLTGSWTEFVSVLPKKGKLVDSYVKDDKEVFVFSKEAEAEVIPLEPYDWIRINKKWWRTKYNFNEPKTIKDIKVKEFGLKRPKNIPLDNEILILFDTVAPVVGKPTIDEEKWHNGKITVSGNIENPTQNFEGVTYSTKIEKVYYCQGTDLRNGELATYNQETGEYTFETADTDYNGKYSIWAEDQAGNISKVTVVNVKIDKTAPNLVEGEKAVTFEQENDDTLSRILNFLTFGTFFNKQVKITVQAQDDGSGVQSIKLITDDDSVVPELVPGSFKMDGRTAQAEFILDEEAFAGSFKVVIKDNVNNEQTVPVTSKNSNIEADNSGIVMVEQNKPVVNISVDPHVDGYMYNGDVTYNFTVSDETSGDNNDLESGINSVIIRINGKEAIRKHYHEYPEKQLNPVIESLHTDDYEPQQDGSYHVVIEAVDNAGNVSTKEIITYKDEVVPEINDIIFSTDGGQGLTGNIQNYVELTEYGFFFKEQVRVTVHASDLTKPQQYTSGVKSIVVYLKDYAEGKYFKVLQDGQLAQITESELGSIEPVETDGEFSFIAPKNFKGQIFAKAIDKVNNESAFATPKGTIIETEQQHKLEEHIKIDKPEAKFKDNKNLDLYAGQVNVNLTVTDTYSGIEKIEWSVVSPYDTKNNQSGALKINNDKTYAAGSNAEGWTQTKTDHNIVTEMTKTITVNNNSNDIVLQVKMTDRAGNTSEEQIHFSIDKTAPTIQYSYDNNRPDVENAKFYNAKRTATIVITERNFKPEDVEYVIANSDGVIPKLNGWRTVPNPENPDQTLHIATVDYTADGDYTFDISYKDLAGNQAPAVEQDSFTIDQTKPEIQVSYNNNSATNGNYFKQDRTATIVIKEHNFDPSRIRITGTATDNGNSIAFPALSGWRTNGDIHTATIHYAQDGKYSFDIDFTDMAGNVMADYKVDEFIVDQTAPELTITGVQDRSANNGDVIPVVTYSDTNFDAKTVKIELTGANRQTVKLNGNFSDIPNGQVFTFNNFERTKENDDIYTLKATLTDRAGNETTETITFSVNRFGSVYVFDESLRDLNGKFVQKEMDVIVTETNVDHLNKDSIQVKMTKDGVPQDLVEGKDYKVTETGGNDQWSQYTYVIDKKNFSGDGKYTVALYSEDAAGNVNENIDAKKAAEISFGVDKTAPVIVPINIEDDTQYPVDTKPVVVSITDNLVLSSASVFLNDKEVEYTVDGENYTFTVPSGNSPQDVRIVAVDAAGNVIKKEVRDILVSTNFFVRLYNNTPLFIGSLAGAGAFIVGVGSYFVFFRKKKDDDRAVEA